MRLAARIVARRSLLAAAVVMLAGGALLAVARWVESGDVEGVLAAWCVVAPALGAMGGLLGSARAEACGEVRALRALGVGDPMWCFGAAMAAVLVGLLPLVPSALGEVPAEGWIRGQGGWIHDGFAVPDVPGESVAMARLFPWQVWLATVLSASLGAWTGARPWSVTTRTLAGLAIGLLACGVALSA